MITLPTNNRSKSFLIIAICLLSLSYTSVFGQENSVIVNDSIQNKIELDVDNTVVADSIESVQDSTAKKSPKMVDAEVVYSAKDSIVLSPKGQQFFLYGDASVAYREINLKAAYIELNMDSTTAYACGVKDSSGVMQGLPVFTDKSGTYTMNTMKYNFKTQKAIIEHVVTEQGEGYVVSHRSKKMDDNTFYVKNGQYSTCDHHDCPHFYLNLTKAKFVPGKKIVTGPAYLVMEDVPIYPLFVPFAIIPTTKKYSSGILMPTYGTETQRGLFLRDGGYYWAASPYVDLATTGEIYTNGSWGLNLASRYKWNYHFGGDFNYRTITTIYSEKDLPDYKKTRDMSIRWKHTPDSKANPYSTFSASVDFSTSSYEQNSINNLVNTQQLATNTKRSSISYSKRFPDSPVNFSINALHSQNSRDTTIDLTIPDFTLTVNKLFPFKSKTRIGEERWYEKVNFAYTGTSKNYIHTKEYELASKSIANDWKNGVKHNIPLSMNLKFLKYFTSSPTINYTERWYYNSITQEYDYNQKKIVNKDTTSGFNRVYDYNASIGTSTKAYMFYAPDRRIFGDKVQAFRHVMTPSVNFSMAPDFSAPKYGYYDQIEYYDATLDTVVQYQYSLYKDAIYGTPGSSRSANLGFSLGNTLDMKVKSLKDSTGLKKVSLLEGLSFSSGYNFLADSLNFNTLNMSGRTSVLKTNISFGAVFDGYAIDTTKAGNPVRINQSSYSKTGDLMRLLNANLSFGFSLNNKTFQKEQEIRNANDSIMEGDDMMPPTDPNFDPNDPEAVKRFTQNSKTKPPVEMGDEGYAKFSIPWQVSFNYSFRLIQDKFDKQSMSYNLKPTSDINMNGNISLTSTWKIGFSTGYNFDLKEVTQTNLLISKDLHCWNMSFNIVPTGKYQSYFFSIRVNSSVLQDLKYEKRSSPRDNPSFYQ